MAIKAYFLIPYFSYFCTNIKLGILNGYTCILNFGDNYYQKIAFFLKKYLKSVHLIHKMY